MKLSNVGVALHVWRSLSRRRSVSGSMSADCGCVSAIQSSSLRSGAIAVCRSWSIKSCFDTASVAVSEKLIVKFGVSSGVLK